MKRFYVGVVAGMILGSGVQAQAADATMIVGTVLSDGTLYKSSSAYTVKHEKTGKYEIDFAQPFSRSAGCLAMPIAAQIASTGLFETKEHCIFFFEDASGKSVDAIFSFIAAPLTK